MEVVSYSENISTGATEAFDALPAAAVDRMVIDFLMEEGLKETAQQLAKESGQESGVSAGGLGALEGLVAFGLKDPGSFDMGADAVAAEEVEVEAGDEADAEVVPDGSILRARGSTLATLLRGEEPGVDGRSQRGGAVGAISWIEQATAGAPPDDKVAAPQMTQAPGGPVLRACSLPSLVRYITSADSPDLHMRDVVLTTLWGFSDPVTVLALLVARYLARGVSAPEIRRLQRVRVFTLLKYWAEKFARDWTPELRMKLSTFIEEAITPTEPKMAQMLVRVLGKKSHDVAAVAAQAAAAVPTAATLDAPASAPATSPGTTAGEPNPGSATQNIAGPNEFLEPVVPNPMVLFSPSLKLRDVDPEEVARQLTLIEQPLLAAVSPRELLSRAWTADAVHGARDCPAVMAVIARHNDVARCLAAMVLSAPRPDDRTKMLAHLVRVAEHLVRMQNFHSLLAVMGAIGHRALARLKTARAALKEHVQRTLADLEELTSPRDGYAALRQALRSGSRSPPLLYPLALTLRDVELVAEVYPDTVDDGMIFMPKWRAMHAVVSSFLSVCTLPYPFHRIHQIAVLLELDDAPTDAELYERSLAVHPKAALR